jgi:hypothetical protein
MRVTCRWHSYIETVLNNPVLLWQQRNDTNDQNSLNPSAGKATGMAGLNDILEPRRAQDDSVVHAERNY